MRHTVSRMLPWEVPAKPPSITEDVRRLAALAAKLGVLLALACHIVPPDYRLLCDAIARVCTGGN